MNDSLSLYTLVDPQLECRLFSAPLELRRAIYSYILSEETHITIHGGKLHLSPCVTSHVVNERDIGLERRSIDDWPNDAVLARRLRSSWGPHWKCEEEAEKIDSGNKDRGVWDGSVVLTLCKRMAIDFADFLVNTSVIHFTDLHTIDSLCHTPASLDGRPSWPISSLCLFASMKKVSITLRLPLTTFSDLDDPAKVDDASANWSRLFLALTDLNELRILQIWLDHDDEISWTSVNERAALNALTHLPIVSGLNISVNLPMLHPGLESIDRHFVPDGPVPPFIIYRRLRQRVFGNRDGEKRDIVTSVEDFPFLMEVMEADRYMIDDGTEEMPLQELEELERGYWKHGMDVQKEINDIFERSYTYSI